MRGFPVLLALAFGLLLPSATAVARRSTAHARRSPTCPARQPVLLTNGQAVIQTGGRAKPHEVFGCVRGHRSYDLGRLEYPAGPVPGRPTREARISELTIAGPMVAFEETQEGKERIAVRDLRAGRFLVRESYGVLGFHAVEQIVVKSDGAVAWIVRENAGWTGNPIVWGVYAVDASGNRLLAEGIAGRDPIAPGSLALAGNTIYWTQGGKPFSAPLN